MPPTPIRQDPPYSARQLNSGMDSPSSPQQQFQAVIPGSLLTPRAQDQVEPYGCFSDGQSRIIREFRAVPKWLLSLSTSFRLHLHCSRRWELVEIDISHFGTALNSLIILLSSSDDQTSVVIHDNNNWTPEFSTFVPFFRATHSIQNVRFTVYCC